MPSVQAIVKCAVMLCFVIWIIQFVLARVSASISAIKVYDDEKEHSGKWCKICVEGNMLEEGGKYATSCITACEMQHDQTTRLELVLDAITKMTYLCGDHPCEEVFAKFVNLRALLFMLVMAYGMRYTIVCTTSAGSHGVFHYAFLPLKIIAKSIAVGFNKIFDVFDNTEKLKKLD